MGYKKEYLITHTHRHGVSSEILNCDPDKFPNDARIIAEILDIDFEPGRDEHIEWIRLETLEVTEYDGPEEKKLQPIDETILNKEYGICDACRTIKRFEDMIESGEMPDTIGKGHHQVYLCPGCRRKAITS